MVKHIAYGGVVVAAAVALAGLGGGGAGASATATGAGQAAGHTVGTAGQAAAVPGAQLWVQRYDGPGNGWSGARAVAVSPTGDRVFVTGGSNDNIISPDSSRPDYATVAYDAATGAQLWVQRYRGPGDRDVAGSLAVSPSGRTVFVTGTSDGGRWVTDDDYATVAYDAATGTQLWVQRYNNGSANRKDSAASVAASPTGGTVFVTGSSNGATGRFDYATVAYNAATGAQLWARRYNGPSDRGDHAYSVAVSPSGGTVFVTGSSTGAGRRNYFEGGADYATVAYTAATGARLWVSRYNGPGNDTDHAAAMTVSPAGGTVFVTGYSKGATSGEDYATVAYRAANGAQLWAGRYNGPGHGGDRAASVAVSPPGDRVFVTGFSAENADSDAYATVAYTAATGTRLWIQRYTGPGNLDDHAYSVAASPTGGTVYVTGSSYGGAATSYDYGTVAYTAATGAQLWLQRYNGPGNPGDNDDYPYSVAVSPTVGTVFVTGWAGQDYTTIAYSG